MRFQFSANSLSSGTFAVLGLNGDESISRRYSCDLELASTNRNIEFKDLIHKAGTIEIVNEDHKSTVYHGLITKFRQLQQIDERAIYRVRLEPQVSKAGWQVQSEVYLDKTLPAIIDGVFKDSGLSALDYELRVIGDAVSRSYEYLCQYEESDLDFMQWLLEQQGVGYYFVDDGTKEKVVFFNHLAGQGEGSIRKLRYQPISDLEDARVLKDAVQQFVRSEEPLPQKVVVRNYDYRKAALDIRAEAMVSANGVGQVALYGEAVGTQSEAQQVADIRAQEIGCRGVVFEGETTAAGIRPGMKIELSNHYRRDFNAEYWVTEVHHEGAQAGAFIAGMGEERHAGRSESEMTYRCVFKAIPSGVQYRPQRQTKRAKIEGTLSGFVDAEGSGKYAELDEQGRYKVQVPFDLTDKPAQRASAWLRFATPYAGAQEGMHFPLRKGTEVLLSFEGGDPNRPIIIGAVANSEHANVVTSRNQTYNMLQTGGGNLLEMEDQEGSQHIVLKSPVKNSFLALGASGGAALVAAALNAANGNGPAEMTQFTEGDQLIKTQGSLRTEVGPNATTRGTPLVGDSYSTLDNNAVVDVAGYAQLNVGSDLSPGALSAGDAQINASGKVVINAKGNCTINCNNYKFTARGKTEVKSGVDYDWLGKSWEIAQNKNQYFEGSLTTLNVGALLQVYGGLYNRVYPARDSFFVGWKLDNCMLTKMEWNWGKIDMVLGLKAENKLTSWKSNMLGVFTGLTSLKMTQVTMDNPLFDLQNAISRLKSAGVKVRTSGVLALL